MASSVGKSKRSIGKHLLKIVIVSLVLITAFLVYVGIHENNRHTQLERSIDVLQERLKSQGISAQKVNSCARLEEEFGRGPMHCDAGSEYFTPSRDQYLRAAGIYMNYLETSREFNINSKPLQLFDIKDTSKYHDVGYIYTPTKSKCGMLYQYIQSKAMYKIQFSCDDTSWFVRTFEG